jgi:hypothetical protein
MQQQHSATACSNSMQQQHSATACSNGMQQQHAATASQRQANRNLLDMQLKTLLLLLLLLLVVVLLLLLLLLLLLQVVAGALEEGSDEDDEDDAAADGAECDGVGGQCSRRSAGNAGAWFKVDLMLEEVCQCADQGFGLRFMVQFLKSVYCLAGS